MCISGAVGQEEEDETIVFAPISFTINMKKPEPQQVRGYRSLKDADFLLSKASCCYICGHGPDAYMEAGLIDDETRRTEWQYVMLLCFRCIDSWDLREANSQVQKTQEEPEPEETPQLVPWDD